MIRIIPVSSTFILGTTLLMSFGAVELRYYDSTVKPISNCRFQAGLCGEDPSVFIAEGGWNASSISTSTST